MPKKKPEPEVISQLDFIKSVAKSQSLSQTAVYNAIKIVKDGVIEMLRQHKSFRLFEFASFNIVEVKEREGRNPSTGDKLTIPAHDVLRIKPTLALKNAVKGSQQATKPKAKTQKKKSK